MFEPNHWKTKRSILKTAAQREKLESAKIVPIPGSIQKRNVIRGPFRPIGALALVGFTAPPSAAILKINGNNFPAQEKK